MRSLSPSFEEGPQVRRVLAAVESSAKNEGTITPVQAYEIQHVPPLYVPEAGPAPPLEAVI
jgi:hypothetical protein